MARLARVVVPDLPHHVTQRGNRREPVFFEEGDYRFYLDLIAEAARRSKTVIASYCLMPNHVHFLMVPSHGDGLRQTFAEAHRRYSGAINARHQWTGHLWQGRFSSTAMDGRHFLAAIAYVALNPVRAGLVARAADWPWSSTRALLAGRDDGVVKVAAVLDLVGDVAAFLDGAEDEAAVMAIRHSRSTGRPVGARDWIAALEASTSRQLAAAKRGPRPRSDDNGEPADLFHTVSP
jgi:putative transposase